ncbi:MAG: hypothetical protein GX092_02515 [Clostridia bacterium]|jgi:hypothetical protein|nr:hypothetical protein [Clostridia bacterium]
MITLKKTALTEDEKDSIGLLTSLLVRYPELCSINYYPYENSLKMGFILQGNIPESALKEYSEELSLCIRTYLYFEKRDCLQHLEINFEHEPNLTRLLITRDTKSLMPKEISLMINLLKAKFTNLLICDECSVFVEEDLLLQDDYIKCMLDTLQARKLNNELIALREDGRVLVFKQ